MRLKFLFISAVMLAGILTGCSKEPETIKTKYFEVPMDDNRLLRMEVPVEWDITEQDAFHYWRFSDGTTLYKTSTAVSVGDQIGNCYYTTYAVSRNFEDASITISTDKNMVATVGALLDRAEIIERDVLQYKELGLDYLPEYADLPMQLTNNGLYMPTECEDVTSVTFTAANTVNGTSFVTSWIMKSKIEDLKPLLNNIATCNTTSGKLVEWYENKEIYYAVSENKVVAARKLTFNQWCCYVASLDSYKDYVTKAMFNIDNIK